MKKEIKTVQKIAIFQEKEVRKLFHNEEWFFCVLDVISVLVDSKDISSYWRKLKQRLKEEWSESVTNCHRLKMKAKDWKMREADFANSETILRLIQSIPSKKAEPFKKWLAKVGYERIQEIEDPELAMKRMKETYEKKWYPKEWVEKRARGIAIRNTLADEWKDRWVENKEYGILTNEIYQATFGMTNKQYKNYKHIPKKWSHNLRDHMTDLELIFTQLAEASTTELTKTKNAEWLTECQEASREGGEVAAKAREDLEKRTWKKVITDSNYLWLKEEKKKFLKKKK